MVRVALLYLFLSITAFPCFGELRAEYHGISLGSSSRTILPGLELQKVLSNGETLYRKDGALVFVLDETVVQINPDEISVGGFCELHNGQRKCDTISFLGEPDHHYLEAVLGDQPIDHVFYEKYSLGIDFWGGYVSRIRLLGYQRWLKLYTVERGYVEK